MDEAPDPSSTLPTKFGRYYVLSAIQGGAMGKLYLAQDPEIDRMVVVKALDAGSSPEQKMRFLREAKAAGRLNHPNVVSIFDVGQQDKTPFIVMEYIEGETLAVIIRNREPILFSRRLELIDQLCAGLGYAHDLGVVHRDIKPSNLMLDKSGKLRILDFGIARLDTSDATQTSTGIIGTLNYMSPEQWEGGVIEGRSDMFSVGAVMYELFSFTKAFPGNTPPEVLRYMFTEGPRPLDEVCPLAPPALCEVTARMMARSAADRYANLHEVREALAALRADVQDIPVEIDDQTIPMGSAPLGRTGTPPVRTGTPQTKTATRQLPNPPTASMTRTGTMGWPARPGSTAAQEQPTVQQVEVPPAVVSPAPSRSHAIRLIAIGAAGVIAIGAIGWFLLRGNGGGTNAGVPPPGVALDAGRGGGASGVTPPPAPVSPPDTSTPPTSAPATNEASVGTKGPASQTKQPAAGGRSATRGAAPAPAPVVPAGPVDLTIKWSFPFDVVQGDTKLSKGPLTTQVLKDVHPDRGEVYAHSDAFGLHQRIPTDKSGTFSPPPPGLLAVELAPKFRPCTVLVDGREFYVGNIVRDRPKPIAAGKHGFSLGKCADGKTEPTQYQEVASGVEVTVISFPKGSGG